jgi:hypothetical protein
MGLLKEGFIPDIIDLQESKRARKRAMHYCWKDERLYFKGLCVPKPEDRLKLVTQMHEDLGHVGEQRTLAEICQRYFWNNRTECVKTIVKTCQQCQMVKSEGSTRSGDERLKSIPICDLFHRIPGNLGCATTHNDFVFLKVRPNVSDMSMGSYSTFGIDQSKLCKSRANTI